MRSLRDGAGNRNHAADSKTHPLSGPPEKAILKSDDARQQLNAQFSENFGEAALYSTYGTTSFVSSEA
jgi:hypothetical protein